MDFNSLFPPTLPELTTQISSTLNPLMSAGIVGSISVHDDGNNLVTVGTVDARLYKTSNYTGSLFNYSVLGNQFEIPLNTTRYIVVSYNNGTPEMQCITDVTNINESDIIPVVSVVNDSSELHFRIFDYWANGSINKHNQRLVFTRKYLIESGLSLSEYGTRYLTVSAGKIWYGIKRYTTTDISSDETEFLYRWHHDPNAPANWTTIKNSGSYNNTHFDDIILGLKEMTDGRYGVNWVYLLVADDEYEIMTVKSRYEYITLDSARLATIPPSPSIIDSHCMLVGRILYLKGAATGLIESAYDTIFTGSQISDHNSTTGLQGGKGGEYYHLTHVNYDTLTDGSSADTLHTHSLKSDKVILPVAGNFAGLDVNGNLTDSGKKPIDYSLIDHLHEGVYYTEEETNTLLNAKSNTDHLHDSRYYTESESDILLSGRAALSHNHSSLALTSGSINGTTIGENTPSTGNFTEIDFDTIKFPNIITTELEGKEVYHGIQSSGTLSFNVATHTFAISSCTYWYNGVKYITANPISCCIDTLADRDQVSGELTSNTLYYFYFKNVTGKLYWSTNFWNLKTTVPVATVFWNGSIGSICRETHSHSRDIDWHIWSHLTVGTAYGSGLDLTLPSVTYSDMLQIEEGSINDEDLIIAISSQTVMRGWYKVNATTYTFEDFSLPYLGTTNTPKYLNNTLYSQGLATFASNKFACYWVYATSDIDKPINIIPTHNSDAYSSLSLARLELPPITIGMNTEWKLLYRFIYSGDGTFHESIDFRRKAGSVHIHDDRYFTEDETTILLTGKAATIHTHTKSNISDFVETDYVHVTGNESIAGNKTFTGQAINPFGVLTLSTTNNNVVIGNYKNLRITGPTANFVITGIAGGVDGREIVLYNTVAFRMTINNDDSGSLSANRILTMVGTSSVQSTTQSVVNLCYSGADSRWIITGFQV